MLLRNGFHVLRGGNASLASLFCGISTAHKQKPSFVLPLFLVLQSLVDALAALHYAFLHVWLFARVTQIAQWGRRMTDVAGVLAPVLVHAFCCSQTECAVPLSKGAWQKICVPSFVYHCIRS